MHILIYRMVGNVAFGWDGYGNDVEVKLPHALASQTRQDLCYVKSVYVTL